MPPPKGPPYPIGPGNLPLLPPGMKSTASNRKAIQLLLRHGGPVDSLDEDRPDGFPMKMILTATKFPEISVGLWWDEEKAKKSLKETDTRVFEFMVGEEDRVWLDMVQTRREDEENA
ncbi:hypothetical protein K469DRAFT_751533 [Zopfia rhizophila CBS 207.26]|uniref:Uncharacterized protein n=1 Tax=Zopfia rhizophila CBS 207.26 TaxID=1314779 RepID=A0A6A6DZ21_9PEZI|nr:hypothetical protein K469DRAFT_751533 [Zopfia rhizophila CBS 207.26]